METAAQGDQNSQPHQDPDHSMQLAWSLPLLDMTLGLILPSDSLLTCKRGLSLEGRAWTLLEEHSLADEVDISKWEGKVTS